MREQLISIARGIKNIQDRAPDFYWQETEGLLLWQMAAEEGHDAITERVDGAVAAAMARLEFVAANPLLVTELVAGKIKKGVNELVDFPQQLVEFVRDDPMRALRLALTNAGVAALALACAPTSTTEVPRLPATPPPITAPILVTGPTRDPTSIAPTTLTPLKEPTLAPPTAPATRAATLEPTPRPNVLKSLAPGESAPHDLQIVPDPRNKYVDRNYQIFGVNFRPFTILKSAYYDGNDVIAIVNFYDKNAGQFRPDRKVRFVDGKGKILFYPNEVSIESIYEGTVINIAFIGKNQFDIFNSDLDKPAEAANGASYLNQRIIEHPPK